MERPAQFAGAKRIVVKIGSAVLRRGAHFDRVTFAGLVRDVAEIRAEGIEVVVVCSGAVALGLSRLELTERPTNMAELQAIAAVGQGRLMRQWNDELAQYDLVAGQVLLTHDDLQDRGRYLSARHTLRALLELGAVPVINENDTVAVDEIKLGDNDMLASQVVSLVEAGLLIILSDVGALYDRDPREAGAAQIPFVARVDADLRAVAGESASGLGSGGMRTKIGAIAQVNHLGVPAILAGGKVVEALPRLFAGESIGTWFAPEGGSVGARKHWIAYSLRPAGALHVDAGAERALVDGGASLLSVGVVRVEGDFVHGDAVSIIAPNGAVLAQGLVSASTEEVQALLVQGPISPSPGPLIHRDDLVLLPT